MAARKSSRGRARKRGGSRALAARRRRQRVRRLVWRSAFVLAGVACFAGFVAGRYLVRLDHVVTARFEGKLFRVPSRVLAAPTVLYPGLDWKRADLPGTLRRLGYREVGAGVPLPPGSLRWSSRLAEIHLRAFVHPARASEARTVRLSLEGPMVSEVVDVDSGREVGAVLLEPERVGSYYGLDREQRELVRLGGVPSHLVDAILAVEDQRFHRHVGIDVQRIVGALWANLRAGGIRQGGSTLTQQLVKNFFLTPERSYKRKVQEALMALIVEARYDKDAILESYLNEIYLGQRGATAIHGVGEASWLYFGKPVADVSLGESALLAAIIQSPNGISPFRHRERSIERRDLVLALMEGQGRIDPADVERAKAEPLRLASLTPESRDVRYFLDALRRQLPVFYDGEILSSEGLRIYSTLDRRLQTVAARSLRDGLEELESRYPHLKVEEHQGRLQGCLLAMRPQTGEVLALVGGRDYGESQFDRCTQARRQAGSIFKPFVYIAALEPVPGGPALTLASHLDDHPFELSTSSGTWRPANFDKKHYGRVPVRTALERSLNVATARLGQRVGAERIAAVARRLGIESPLPLVPSLAIGTADVSPAEVARAYAAIANGGIRPEFRTFEDVVDGAGRPLERQKIEFARVLDAGTAYLATNMLQGVVDRGTGRAVRRAGIKGPIAAKTGTSDDERDAWFVGFTPELVVVVWVGFDEPRSMKRASTSVAAPIFVRFLREVSGGTVRGVFPRPRSVVELEIEAATGARALPECRGERRKEFFLAGTEPQAMCPAWIYAEHDGRERRQPRPERRRRTFFDFLEDLFGDSQ